MDRGTQTTLGDISTANMKALSWAKQLKKLFKYDISKYDLNDFEPANFRFQGLSSITELWRIYSEKYTFIVTG